VLLTPRTLGLQGTGLRTQDCGTLNSTPFPGQFPNEYAKAEQDISWQFPFAQLCLLREKQAEATEGSANGNGGQRQRRQSSKMI